MSFLSSSSIESQIYAIVCVSTVPWPSGGSPSSSVSIDSSSLSFARVISGVFVSHQIFLFFVALGKKVGAAIAGSPCTPSALHTRLIVCKMCLVGVKILAVSSCLWDVQDSLILCRVSEVNPHFVLRAFHVPLVMVHPWVGWARVVNPSCVMTVEPCMFSSHRRDFCWICTHPSPLSDVGRASFSESSRSVILMFESVIRGGWLAMSGGGSWCQFTAGGGGSVRERY